MIIVFLNGTLFKRSDIMTKHGLSTTKIYRLYYSIKQRCASDRKREYDYYKSKGIVVCDEWLNDFMAFYNWCLDNGYQEGLQIDRIDSNKNYEPSNCRFVDITINCRNQKTRKDNTSGIKGINYDKRKNLWVVRISVDGKRLYIGRFKKLEDAKEARKQAELTYWTS